MMEGAIGPYWYAQKTCLNLGSVCIAMILQVVDMRKQQVEYYDSLNVDTPLIGTLQGWNTLVAINRTDYLVVSFPLRSYISNKVGPQMAGQIDWNMWKYVHRKVTFPNTTSHTQLLDFLCRMLHDKRMVLTVVSSCVRYTELLIQHVLLPTRRAQPARLVL